MSPACSGHADDRLARLARSSETAFWGLDALSIVRKLVVLALIGLGAFFVWRKVQADRAELDLWTEATTADE
jgi:hypothetical protein